MRRGGRKWGQEDSRGEGGSRRGTKRTRSDYYSFDSGETESGGEAGAVCGPVGIIIHVGTNDFGR